MKTFNRISLLSLSMLVVAACVQSRDPRNGVFNENVYLRKDFLIRDGASPTSVDTGWMLKATIVSASSPNPFGDMGIVAGYHSQGQLVRWRVTQDHLDMLDMRELDETDSTGKIPEVVNSWGATNVDLKYRINLDGEATNFYEENQELPWEQRQWVKLNLAKNDLSDIAAMGVGWADTLNHCTDVGESSATLELPEVEVVIDDSHGYLQWTVNITVPLPHRPAGVQRTQCGPMLQPALQLDRPNVTFQLMYSMVRADPAPTYIPLPVADERPDPPQRYGPITFISE